MSAHAATDHHHHEVRPEDWPDEPFHGKASVGKVGMWIFLLSDAMMFAGFLIAYGILRGEQAMVVDGEIIEYWRCTQEMLDKGVNCIAPEPVLGINFTAALTFLLICSSVSMAPMILGQIVTQLVKKNAVTYGLPERSLLPNGRPSWLVNSNGGSLAMGVG